MFLFTIKQNHHELECSQMALKQRVEQERVFRRQTWAGISLAHRCFSQINGMCPRGNFETWIQGKGYMNLYSQAILNTLDSNDFRSKLIWDCIRITSRQNVSSKTHKTWAILWHIQELAMQVISTCTKWSRRVSRI